DGVDALPPPCPHRRADVVNRTHAAPLEPRLEAEIEIGRIHTDEQRSLSRAQPSIYLATDAHELRNVAQYLDDAADGELFQRIPQLAAGGFHPWAPDACETHARGPLDYSAYELRAESIARRLAGHDA